MLIAKKNKTDFNPLLFIPQPNSTSYLDRQSMLFYLLYLIMILSFFGGGGILTYIIFEINTFDMVLRNDTRKTIYSSSLCKTHQFLFAWWSTSNILKFSIYHSRCSRYHSPLYLLFSHSYFLFAKITLFSNYLFSILDVRTN